MTPTPPTIWTMTTQTMTWIYEKHYLIPNDITVLAYVVWIHLLVPPGERYNCYSSDTTTNIVQPHNYACGERVLHNNLLDSVLITLIVH